MVGQGICSDDASTQASPYFECSQDRIEGAGMKKTTPLITVDVIIPAYNYAEFLAEAIESALAQKTPPNTKVVCTVVDDGSTDDTAAVAKRYKARGVHYVYRDNGGLSAARNTGLEHTNGDYVCFLDADDRLKPSYVAKSLAAIKKASSEVGYVYSQFEFFGDETGISTFKAFDIELLKRENFIHASVFFRRSCFKTVKYTEVLRSGWEDWDVYLSLAEQSIIGQLIDVALLDYRQHGSTRPSMTDLVAREVQQNALKLRIQSRHISYLGWGIVLHTFARQVRLRLGIKR